MLHRLPPSSDSARPDQGAGRVRSSVDQGADEARRDIRAKGALQRGSALPRHSLQCDAAKYGHTLLGGPADDKCRTMIFFENSYSADTRDQTSNRITTGTNWGIRVYVDMSGPI